MNYLAYLFLSHLPHVEEEVRFIDGKEQPCLIIPTETNQIKKGRQGNWLMILRLAERPPNARQQTHEVQLMYLSEKYIKEYRANGIHDRTMRMGRVYEHDRTPAKKLDRTNKATDIGCAGRITLSDIPADSIFRNAENAKRYVGGLRFGSYSDKRVVYTGCVCVDDIPVNEIKTDPDTGKKYIDAVFKRMPKLDTYMNTHHLVIITDSGAEVEIGRFKEWMAENKAEYESSPAPVPPQEHTTTVNPRDTSFSIDGINF